MPTLQIDPIPAFNDNYIWLFYRKGSAKAWVVDPGDAKPVLHALQTRNLVLTGVLLTHHHGDHDGGISQLKQAFPSLRVVCGANSQSPHGNEPYANGESILILDYNWQVLDIPGHTLDHIAFYCAEINTLFCGDTLFAGGCGRIFEGSPEQMYKSLQKLAALPPQTLVYCAHEYTQANLRFADVLEPDNLALQNRIKRVKQARAANQATIPSQLSEELETNPFLRSHIPAIFHAADEHMGIKHRAAPEVFSTIRAWKNEFQ